ncbi:MAG: MFS transporter, partial [Paramuribaculum sp.]|nr:MFS transporter [Paramuribaculum sp.]
AMTVPVAGDLGKKTTFILVNAARIALSVAFFFVPVTPSGYWWMLLLQILISVLTGIMSPLVWSMYADVSDYSELKNHTASTGLIFSSSSMAQKFGGAIGGAAVLWLLDACGYIAGSSETDGAITQTSGALTCLWRLMTFIPAGVSLLAIIVVSFYPLTTSRVESIVAELKQQRLGTAKNIPAEDEMTDFANTNS